MFKSASKIIQGVFSEPEVKKHFTGLRLEWTFNLGKGLWWEGGGGQSPLYQPIRELELCVSLMPLCMTRQWASIAISAVSGWFLWRSIGVWAEEGRSEFDILPPHLHIWNSSTYRLNWYFHKGNLLSCCSWDWASLSQYSLAWLISLR